MSSSRTQPLVEGEKNEITNNSNAKRVELRDFVRTFANDNRRDLISGAIRDIAISYIVTKEFGVFTVLLGLVATIMINGTQAYIQNVAGHEAGQDFSNAFLAIFIVIILFAGGVAFFRFLIEQEVPLPILNLPENSKLLVTPMSGKGSGYPEQEIVATPIMQYPTFTPLPQTENLFNGNELGTPTSTPIIATLIPETIGDEHHVLEGENLFRIGLRYGCTVREMAAHNAIRNPNRIYIGQIIKIPVCNRN